MSANKYFGQSRAEVLPLVPDNCGNVLEIGCGEAGFSAQLTGAAERWGIEPDPAAARVASTVLDHVLEGTFEGCIDRLPPQHFDVVVCNDVIEHMPDHDRFLQQVRACMRPGAVIVASIPNLRHSQVLWELLVHRDFRYREAGVLDRTHLRFFTSKSLRRTLEENGYRVERFEMINRLPIRFRLERLVLLLLTLLTLGVHRDCWYRQFAVRARLV